MAKDLLNMDRLPTMAELKEFFRENDWTTMKLDDPAQRTAEAKQCSGSVKQRSKDTQRRKKT